MPGLAGTRPCRTGQQAWIPPPLPSRRQTDTSAQERYATAAATWAKFIAWCERTWAAGQEHAAAFRAPQRHR